MDAFNIRLFLWINGTAHSPDTVVYCARWCAENLIYVVLLLPFAACIGKPRSSWKLLLYTVGALACALLLRYMIAGFYFHPRPFMMEIGHTFIPYAATSSYPSGHGTLSFSVVGSLLLAQRWMWGMLALVLAVVIAWARVYVGVHFPLDMAGAFGVAVVANLMVVLVRRLSRRASPIINADKILYRRKLCCQRKP